MSRTRAVILLARVVHGKTRGSPFFAIQFLRSIIQNKLLSFLVKSQRWAWDVDVVDLQMISDGVAEILATTFDRLPPALMRTLEVMSCLGSQMEYSTIDVLDSNGVFPFNIQNEFKAEKRDRSTISRTLFSHLRPHPAAQAETTAQNDRDRTSQDRGDHHDLHPGTRSDQRIFRERRRSRPRGVFAIFEEQCHSYQICYLFFELRTR